MIKCFSAEGDTSIVLLKRQGHYHQWTLSTERWDWRWRGGGVSQKVLTVILIMGLIAKIVFKTLEERLFKAKTSEITDYCWSVKWETLFSPLFFLALWIFNLFFFVKLYFCFMAISPEGFKLNDYCCHRDTSSLRMPHCGCSLMLPLWSGVLVRVPWRWKGSYTDFK